MTEDEIKGIFGCFAIGGGLMWKAIHKRKTTRKIADTPRSKVASAPQGYVEVEGFAWPATGTVNSSTGDEVVYYSLQVQRSETRGSGKSRRKEWVTVFTHGHVSPFYLVDATGLALVDPVTSELDLEAPRIRNWSALKADEKARIASIASARSIPGFPPMYGFFGFFSSNYRIVERDIGVGSPLYLHGDFRSPSGDLPRVLVPGLTEFTSRVFNAEGRGLKNLSHFLDKDRDGKVSGAESRQGYAFAARQARIKAKGQTVGEKDFGVSGHLGSSSMHRLLIADLHENHLVTRRGKYVWLQFLGGAALLGLGTAQMIPGGLGFADMIGLFSSGKNLATQMAGAPSRALEDGWRKPTSSDPEVMGYHRGCVGGDPLACVTLLERQDWKHSPENKQLYRSQACAYGELKFCER